MLDFNYVYKKEVDWSLLNQGLSIPLNIQVIFRNNIKKFISRGESKDICLALKFSLTNYQLIAYNNIVGGMIVSLKMIQNLMFLGI